MKKIILSVLSVLMIFGLIGCNGALHDYKDPEVFEGGTWYYYDVPTDAANDAGWPGKPMTKNGETPVVIPVYTITFVVDGFAAEQTVVANGTPWGWNGWPFVSWNGGDEGKTTSWIENNAASQVLTADEEGILVVTVDIEGLPGSQSTVMFVETTVTDGVYTNGNQTGDIPVVLPEEPGSYIARITFAAGTTTPAKFN